MLIKYNLESYHYCVNAEVEKILNVVDMSYIESEKNIECFVIDDEPKNFIPFIFLSSIGIKSNYLYYHPKNYSITGFKEKINTMINKENKNLLYCDYDLGHSDKNKGYHLIELVAENFDKSFIYSKNNSEIKKKSKRIIVDKYQGDEFLAKFLPTRKIQLGCTLNTIYKSILRSA